MNTIFFRPALAMALSLPLVAAAQEDSARPVDDAASAASLLYRSAFSDYRPWQEIRPGDWRALNDNVREVAARRGSSTHNGHLMGQPSPAAPASAAPAEAPTSDRPSHGGPHEHGGKQ